MAFRVIGLTGGIACGKSAVAAHLRARGQIVVDADQLARDVTLPGEPAVAEIAALWPHVVVSGRVDRAALGQLVFADASARAALERVLHPRIAERARAAWSAAAAAGHTLGFYEAALLVETGAAATLDGLVVVTTSPERQVAWLMARNALSRPEAEARIAAQMPLADKVRHATWHIDNRGSLDDLAAQTDTVLAAIRSTD